MNNTNLLVEHLFRRQWGDLVATLTRRFGFQNLELIEDAVQEAMFAALKSWPTRGVPANQPAWLLTVARNRLLDSLRSLHQQTEHGRLADSLADAPDSDPVFRSEISDDYLRLIFLCCDPEIPPDARSALTLQLACGFGTREIAAAFLTTEPTIAKRIYRAKANLMTHGFIDDDLKSDLLFHRLDSVLEVIYLLFSEGYSSHDEDRLIRHELCAEALRLIRLLASHNRTAFPQVFALGSLLCLQSARLDSRLGTSNELLLLEDQDRSRWCPDLISEGLSLLERSAAGSALSRYHLEAGIAACHVTAANYSETDWQKILYYYDQLLELYPGALVRLNRAVALAQVHGIDLALAELRGEQTFTRFQNYCLFHATLADLTRRSGNSAAAATHYRRALDLASNQIEREFLRRRLLQCEAAT